MTQELTRNQAINVPLDTGGHVNRTDEQTDLDVARLSRLGEIRGADEGSPTINNDAFRVEACPRAFARLQRAWIVK